MKKIFTTLALCAAAAVPAFALTPTYKGFGEMQWGVAVPSGESYGAGMMYGMSTSHGVTLIDGLFIGAGLEANIAAYSYDEDYGYYYFEETDVAALLAMFAEGRYNILRTKRISPFIGLRVGGGYNGYDDTGSFYFSPAAGCTFNLTRRFGLDASIGYELFTGRSGYWDAGNIHCLTFRVGVHF